MIIKASGYNILIKRDLFSFLNKELNELLLNKTYFVITDEYVFSLYKDKLLANTSILSNNIVTVKQGEISKSYETYLEVINKLIALNIKRDDLIIAFGGGVIGDLAGFVAATLYRGIKYIQIPTTLLAQVDSSIGAKVGINYHNNKNILGSFYKPLKVFIDPSFLETLNYEYYKDGIAEMIKISLLKDQALFNHLRAKRPITETEIARAIYLKNEIVDKDEFDHSLRMILNFGHTFGHQIEVKNNLSHGSAISYGMLIALEIGISLNKTNKTLYDTLKSLLLSYGLIKTPLIKKADYINLIWHDKKRLNEGLNFIIVNDYEKPEIIAINKDDLF